MTTCRIIVLAAMIVCLGGLALAQDEELPLSNWSAPPYWGPTVHPQAERGPGDGMLARDQGMTAHAEALPSSPLPFVAIPPCRVVDTRVAVSDGFHQPNFMDDEARTFLFPSSPDCPGLPSLAGAWSVNIQFRPMSQLSYLTAYPTGSTRPLASTITAGPAAWVQNSAVVPAGTGGAIDIYCQYAGRVVIDVNGYYGPQSVVTSLNTKTGDVTLVEGANITITPSANTLTIASSGGIALPFTGSAAIDYPGAVFDITNNGGGVGVHGVSDTSFGVEGESTSWTGVFGGSSSGPGVHGRSTSSDGVFGESTDGAGVRATSTTGDGVVAEASAAGKSGVVATNLDPGGFAGTFNGAVQISGPLTCLGCVGSGALADGVVGKPKLGAPGGTAGQVLGTDGAVLVWQDPAGGTITGVTANSGLTGGGTSGDVTVGIATGGVQTAMLADAAVTTDKILGSSVTNAKIADASVGSAKIIDGSIGPQDIADTAITKAKLNATGGTNGQVLGTDGSGLTWRDDGLTLPYIVKADNGTPFMVRVVNLNSTYGNPSALWGTAAGEYIAAAGAAGVLGDSRHGTGVAGYSQTGFGVTGTSETADGVHGYSESGDGVFGGSLTGRAGTFIGDVNVTGILTKGGGAFKIDHPLDPENRYLYHSFVESPDMKNIYDGVAVTDEEGLAVVELPEWFEALNRDFRYQLTVIGRFAQAIIEQEVEGNRFSIRTNLAKVKVSWQVTGIRRDAYAEAHRIPVEQDKPEAARGTYLHPDAFGKPRERGVDWARHPETMRRLANHDEKARGVK